MVARAVSCTLMLHTGSCLLTAPTYCTQCLLVPPRQKTTPAGALMVQRASPPPDSRQLVGKEYQQHIHPPPAHLLYPVAAVLQHLDLHATALGLVKSCLGSRQQLHAQRHIAVAVQQQAGHVKARTDGPVGQGTGEAFECIRLTIMPETSAPTDAMLLKSARAPAHPGGDELLRVPPPCRRCAGPELASHANCGHQVHQTPASHVLTSRHPHLPAGQPGSWSSGKHGSSSAWTCRHLTHQEIGAGLQGGDCRSSK